MSSRSISKLDKNTYIEKNEERLLKMSDQYFFSKYFLLGKEVDRDEMVFSTITSAFLYSSNCKINNLIRDKIEGKLESEIKKKTPTLIHTNNNGDEIVPLTDVYWDNSVSW